AIASTSAAIVRMKPADAARAPAGPTKTTIGVLAAIMCETISRVESTSPPGVRSVNTTSAAPVRSARSIVSIMYSADTGWMMLSTSAAYTSGGALVEDDGRGWSETAVSAALTLKRKQLASRPADRARMTGFSRLSGTIGRWRDRTPWRAKHKRFPTTPGRLCEIYLPARARPFAVLTVNSENNRAEQTALIGAA